MTQQSSSKSAALADLSTKLDSCFKSLPVDLTPLLSSFTEDESNRFLEGNLLERLIVSLFNESDARISSLETKAQVLGLLRAVAQTSRRGLVRVRLLLHATPQWIDEDADVEGKTSSELQVS
ncbi:hypothetical protein EON64_15785 [archaeon]|nr:MAG: hypothetical protein EON64_15785 [archaeon]